MKIQQRPGLAPGIAPHFARRRTSSGCMRRNAAASESESVRVAAGTAARSVDSNLVMVPYALSVLLSTIDRDDLLATVPHLVADDLACFAIALLLLLGKLL